MDAATRPSTRRMAFAIDVEASPDGAFALISDIERHDEWSPQEFEATRIGGGPIGVGTRYRTASRKGTRKGVMRTTELVFTEFSPTTRFAFAATEKAGTYRTTFVIAPSGDGSHVERIVDPPTSGAVAFIRHRLLARVVRAYMQQNMDALKARLNAGAPTTS